MQFFILPASDAGQWTKEETRDIIPRKYQERKSCLLGGGAGRSSSDRLSYRVIEKANLNRPCMVDAKKKDTRQRKKIQGKEKKDTRQEAKR